MDITKYKRKIEQLSRYMPHLVSIEQMKAKLYERGMYPEIRQIISFGELTTYKKVVNRPKL